jgi:hypothetical protein
VFVCLVFVSVCVRACAACVLHAAQFEIAAGMLHVAEALLFMHRDAHMAHGDVGPHSIVIAKNGTWKLSCMGAARSIAPGGGAGGPSMPPPPPAGTGAAAYKRAQFPTRPPVRWAAPEAVSPPPGGATGPTSAGDMWSYGLFFFELLAYRGDDGRLESAMVCARAGWWLVVMCVCVCVCLCVFVCVCACVWVYVFCVWRAWHTAARACGA